MTANEIGDGLRAAITLSTEGRQCFPCLPTKRPATPRGFRDATADLGMLCTLWARHPGSLVGVATGAPSGIDELDLDKKHREAVAWWTRNRHRLPRTRTHRTRSGGLHLLFQHAQGMRCTAGKITSGVDSRGEAVISFGGRQPGSRCCATRR